MRGAKKEVSCDRNTMAGGCRSCGCGWGGGKQCCVCPDGSHVRYEHRESMEPQLSHSDIHMEELTKRRLRAATRFGTDLLENTPPLGDCPTVALWRSTAALHCFGAPDKWTRARVGQRPAEDENTLLCGRTIRARSRTRHPSKWRWHLIKQT